MSSIFKFNLKFNCNFHFLFKRNSHAAINCRLLSQDEKHPNIFFLFAILFEISRILKWNSILLYLSSEWHINYKDRPRDVRPVWFLPVLTRWEQWTPYWIWKPSQVIVFGAAVTWPGRKEGTRINIGSWKYICHSLYKGITNSGEKVPLLEKCDRFYQSQVSSSGSFGVILCVTTPLTCHWTQPSALHSMWA